MAEEAKLYSKRLAELNETGLLLTSELNLDELLDAIVNRALNLLGGEYCNCFLHDPELNLLERAAYAGLPLNLGNTRQCGEGFVGQVWATGGPLLVSDYHSWQGRRKEYDSLPPRTLMGVPIRWGEEFLGVLNITAPLPHEFTQADLEVLSLFAMQAAIAIRNARLFTQLKLELAERKRAEQEMAILADIGQVIGSTLDVEKVYERFASITRKVIPFDALRVNLIDAPHNQTHIAYFSGIDLPGRTAGRVGPISGTMTEYVMKRRKATIIHASSAEEMTRLYPEITSFLSIGAGFRSNMLIPLFSNDAMIGTLHFRAKKENAYSEADLRLAERIGMQIAGAIANARLFNDLSKTEKALRERNEVFSLFIQHSPINTFIKEVTPSQSFVLQASDNYRQKIGIPPCEMAGKTMAELFPPEFAAKVTADDWAAVCKGDVLRLEEELNGRSYTTIKFPIVQGDKTLLAGYSIDITEGKRSEEEKRSLEERLQRAKKMEALGQLAGGVAHDLNNFLGALSGYSELLLREIPEGNRSRRYVERILQSTEKGAAIIEDLLTLARRNVTALDVINLKNVVSGFLKTPVFEKIRDYHPQVIFRTEHEKNLQNIKGSPVHLEKTLMNLVSNAAEAISGKGEVTIRTENCYLDKPFGGYDEIEEGDYAVLRVSDTGVGISAENVEKIFEPFYTKKTMGRSGTGLGLAIVWGTVKDHNGYIDVRTEVGKGTTFTLFFPVTREDLVAQELKEPMDHYMGKGETILVVDDIAEQRDVAVGLLTLLGYDVHAVSSGDEAVEYLKRSRADILVLDMIMPPGIDGLTTYQKILEINPKQKAILAVGFLRRIGSGRPKSWERVNTSRNPI